MIFHRWIYEKENFYYLAGYEKSNGIFASDLISFPSISSLVQSCLEDALIRKPLCRKKWHTTKRKGIWRHSSAK